MIKYVGQTWLMILIMQHHFYYQPFQRGSILIYKHQKRKTILTKKKALHFTLTLFYIIKELLVHNLTQIMLPLKRNRVIE